MRLATLLTASAALALMAAPAMAQQAAPPPVPSAQPAPSTAAEAEIEAEAEKFQAAIEQLEQELTAAHTASAGDAAKYRADSAPIVAKYQPAADDFADKMAAFAASSGAPVDAQAQMTQAVAMIRTVPTMVRDAIAQGGAEQAAPAQPQ